MPISRITPDRNQENLTQDLEKYRQHALEHGATAARIVDTSEIPIEDAVVFKCKVPRCFGCANCAQCPPHAPKPEEIRELLKGHTHGVFFTKKVASRVLKLNRNDDDRKRAFRGILEIVSRIESAAFYDGHYLAVGFGAGSCFFSLCDPKVGCEVLKGGRCRFPLKVRPSVEAVGLDVYRMVASSGWEIYPFDSQATPEEIPFASLAGLVLIQ